MNNNVQPELRPSHPDMVKVQKYFCSSHLTPLVQRPQNCNPSSLRLYRSSSAPIVVIWRWAGALHACRLATCTSFMRPPVKGPSSCISRNFGGIPAAQRPNQRFTILALLVVIAVVNGPTRKRASVHDRRLRSICRTPPHAKLSTLVPGLQRGLRVMFYP